MKMLLTSIYSYFMHLCFILMSFKCSLTQSLKLDIVDILNCCTQWSLPYVKFKVLRHGDIFMVPRPGSFADINFSCVSFLFFKDC